MKSLFNKIFFKKLGSFNLLTASFGFVLGLVVVTLSMNFYIKFDRLKTKNKNYILVNKEPKIFSSKQSSGFTINEIKDLNEQAFVKDVSGLYGADYKIWVDSKALNLKTLLMFESIEDNSFIDLPELPESFKNFDMNTFDPDKDFIPVILSQDLLNLYNYVFSFVNKTPQIPNSAIESQEFGMYVWGDKHPQREKYKLRIVGLSDRYATLIMPHGFMKWANEKYQGTKTDIASRVVVETKRDANVDVDGYCEKNGFLVNRDEVKSHETIAVMNIIITILAVFGFIFIFFAVTIVNLIFSLIVARVKEEIQLLLQQGFSVKQIQSHLVSYLAKFMVILSAISVGLFFLGNMVTLNYVVEIFRNVRAGVEIFVIVSFIGFVGISFMVSLLSIKKALKSYN